MKLDRTPRPSSTPSCTGTACQSFSKIASSGVDIGHGHGGVPETSDAERMLGPATGADVPVVLEARVVGDIGAVRAVGVAGDLHEESTDRSRRRVEVVDVGRDLFHAAAAGQSDVHVVVEQVTREAFDVVDHVPGRMEARAIAQEEPRDGVAVIRGSFGAIGSMHRSLTLSNAA